MFEDDIDKFLEIISSKDTLNSDGVHGIINNFSKVNTVDTVIALPQKNNSEFIGMSIEIGVILAAFLLVQIIGRHE